jgi:ABC-type Na+ efflux pump permease subunit
MTAVAPSDARAAAKRSSREPIDWNAVNAIVCKDLIAVRRAKGVFLPMLLVPFLLLVVVPFFIGLATRVPQNFNVDEFLSAAPGGLADPIMALPERQRLVVLVNGYLLAPLFLIVPIMVSAVLAADAFAGEKERKTLESLLHLPIRDRDLFIAKVLTALLPAIAISWIGFVAFAFVANSVAWGVTHRIFVPTKLWMVVILWVAPAVAMLGLAVMVRVSARAKTTQEANQLGGAVILPLIVLAMGQASGLLLVTLPIAFGIGLVMWVVALILVRGGARRFERDALAQRI